MTPGYTRSVTRAADLFAEDVSAKLTYEDAAFGLCFEDAGIGNCSGSQSESLTGSSSQDRAAGKPHSQSDTGQMGNDESARTASERMGGLAGRHRFDGGPLCQCSGERLYGSNGDG